MFDRKDKPTTNKTGNYDDDEEFYSYYPPVVVRLGKNYDQAKETALNMLPSGIVQYTNQIVLKGSYIINRYFKLSGQTIYSIVNNSKHITDKTEHGVELSISLTYNIF